MFKKPPIVIAVIALILSACDKPAQEINGTASAAIEPAQETSAKAEDQYLWLEDVLGEESLAWVRAENARTLGILESDPRFHDVEARALGIYNATDKIVYADRSGDEMHDFWRDET